MGQPFDAERADLKRQWDLINNEIQCSAVDRVIDCSISPISCVRVSD